MPFETPRLDDRTFEDLVQEARRRIPLYTPEWTDHNLSDPGITLIELFAWMTDVMLYRLNRVPDKHYIKLMELIGMHLREPQAASTHLTFWLSAPQDADVQIPLFTQAGTPQTENNPSITFSSTEAFTIHPAELTHVMTSEPPKKSGQSRTYRELNLKRLNEGFDGTMMFSDEPKDGDAIYFGFKTDLSHHILGFEMDVDVAGGAGVDPSRPPYEWQALSETSPIVWNECEVDVDGTRSFNVPGVVRIHLPKLEEGEINGHRAYWVRCRIIEPPQGVPQYRKSPVVRQLTAGTWGGTVPASHSTVVTDENMGRSDGSPGQNFFLEFSPVLERKEDERLLIRISSEQEELWTEVPDFAGSSAEDKHYTIDSDTGELRFGPAMRQQDGTIRRYGAIPPKDAVLVMKKYRHGGGAKGNVQRNALNVLMTSIPYVNAVRNRGSAIGGLDRETLDHAKLRVPGYLRSLERAVTAKDYEYLALQAAPGKIARVFALQPPNSSIGEVKVLLIPHVGNPKAYIEPGELEVPEAMKKAVNDYLDERRMLATRLDVTSPAYYWIGTRIRMRVSDHANPEKVRDQAVQRLFEFINPLVGGYDGAGWQFGRDLHTADIIAALQNVPGIDFIRSVEIFPVTMREGDGTYGEVTSTIETVAHGVMASYRHEVRTDQD